MRLSYCGDQVRRYDNDRYLTALHAPASRRDALFALYAFNLEVAKTREAVSEPMIGHIRLQWWREAIEGAYSGVVRDHAALRPLAQAINQHNLTRSYFDTLIDAREFDLTDEPPAALDDMASYAEGTNSALIRLALEILGQHAGAAHEAARGIGVAWGLTGLLRAVAFHARDQRQYLPARLMREAQANRDDLFALRGGQPLAVVARQVADAARQALHKGRINRRAVPRAAIPALLPGTLAEMYLRRMARLEHDVFARPILISQPARQLGLLRSMILGRY
ncbi:MAG: squalene/phytoene synthase family protein [Alphaproteobacteria bacterium]|nr:squalene/phytoene synthase family protein [Alphaproteobacteria bacterium]